MQGFGKTIVMSSFDTQFRSESIAFQSRDLYEYANDHQQGPQHERTKLHVLRRHARYRNTIRRNRYVCDYVLDGDDDCNLERNLGISTRAVFNRPTNDSLPQYAQGICDELMPCGGRKLMRLHSSQTAWSQRRFISARPVGSSASRSDQYTGRYLHVSSRNSRRACHRAYDADSDRIPVPWQLR